MFMTPRCDAQTQQTADFGMSSERVAGMSAWQGYWCYWFSAGVPVMRSN